MIANVEHILKRAFGNQEKNYRKAENRHCSHSTLFNYLCASKFMNA